MGGGVKIYRPSKKQLKLKPTETLAKIHTSSPRLLNAFLSHQ